MAQQHARFVIYLDRTQEYRWRFRAVNGEIMADSGEGYATKWSCQQAIKTVKAEVPDAEVLDTTG